MDSGDETQTVSSGFRPSPNNEIEESGLLGTRRGWANINRFEIAFLILGVVAAVTTDVLTIIRLLNVHDNRDPDLAYGILILVHSVFLLLFLITGIFYQRITDIIAFFISAVLLTTYVVAHYIARSKTEDDSSSKDALIRLIRLILTIVFNVCFFPLAILVIRDYRRDEFSKRLFGAFPAARRPLKLYSIFDCLARINTMLSISSLLLNLYNFNAFEPSDKILLGIGIPLAFLWLGVGVGMLRLENRLLVASFYIISIFQPGFLIYSLYTAVNHSSEVSPTISPISSTLTTSSMFTTEFANSTITSSTMPQTTTKPLSLIPVLTVLYVCLLLNLVTHVLSMVFGFYCVRNFGKGLKERVFDNRFDKWFGKIFG